MEVVPAIDLYDGKCVRLKQGDFSKITAYDYKPVDFALMIEQAGLKRLHLVDLEGAKRGSPVNLKTLEKIARDTELLIDYGGGLTSSAALVSAFSAGATDLCIGTVAVTEPELFAEWVQTHGADRIVIAADVRDRIIAVKGWLESSEISIDDQLSKWIAIGAKRVLCTDIAKDGMLQGPAENLYRSLLEQHQQLQLWASGGVRSLADLTQLREIGCAAAVVGKALHEGHVSLAELGRF